MRTAASFLEVDYPRHEASLVIVLPRSLNPIRAAIKGKFHHMQHLIVGAGEAPPLSTVEWHRPLPFPVVLRLASFAMASSY